MTTKERAGGAGALSRTPVTPWALPGSLIRGALEKLIDLVDGRSVRFDLAVARAKAMSSSGPGGVLQQPTPPCAHGEGATP